MKTFKGILLVVIFFLSINISNIAQTENKTETKNLHSFSVYFINGYALGYDYYKTDAFKLRATLDLSLSGSDENSDGESRNIQYGSTYNGARDITVRETDRNSFGVSLSTQIIFPIYKTEFGNIYFGAGPSVGYSKDHNTSSEEWKSYYPDTVTTPSLYSSSSENTIQSYNVAANLMLGAEAIVSDNVSLFIEAHLNGGINWSDEKRIYRYKSNQNYEELREYNYNGDGWFYSFQYARIGVKISI